MTISRDDFERQYAERSGISVEQLRAIRTARPCRCGDEHCEGWQALSHERAAEYDKNAAEGVLPGKLW